MDVAAQPKPDSVVWYSHGLKQPCRPIEIFGETVNQLRDRLIVAMHRYGGVGLAANQIGVNARVAICKRTDSEILTIVNPEVIDSSGIELNESEGCLSLPFDIEHGIPTPIYARTKRPRNVKLRYQDENGTWHELSESDAFARCIMHEVDHLNGIMFIDHLSRLMADMVLVRYKKFLNDPRVRRVE